MKNQEWPPGGDKDKGKFQLNENQLRERVPTLRCQIWHITNNTPKMRSKVRHVIKYILMSHISRDGSFMTQDGYMYNHNGN